MRTRDGRTESRYPFPVTVPGARFVRPRVIAALAAVAASVGIAVFGPNPNPYLRSAERFHDFLHVPGFALVAALLLAAFPGPPPGPGPHRRGRHLARVFAAAVGLGVAVELLQAVAGGDVSLPDVARDAGGAAAAVLVAASFWPGVQPARRWALRLAAAVTVAAFTQPTIEALLEERRARAQFPVLADFSHPGEMGRFKWSAQTIAVPVAGDAGGGAGRGVRLLLSPGRYPGFTLAHFPRDWRAYRDLVLTCTNPSPEPLPVTIRIDDRRGDRGYEDRFNGRYVLQPGRNVVRVSLAEVAAAPRRRRLNLARIRQVVVFTVNLPEPRELLLESLRLER